MGLFKRAPKVPPVDPAEVAELRHQLADLRSQLESFSLTQSVSTQHLEEVDGKLISLSTRITQVGTEVTHQLGELSREIDSLGAHSQELATVVGEIPASLQDIRVNQERLATEQARYQIAFGQDLAEVAEMVMKKR